MKPGDLIISKFRCVGLNLTFLDLRMMPLYQFTSNHGDVFIVLEKRNMGSERYAYMVLTKFGVMWCKSEELERHVTLGNNEIG